MDKLRTFIELLKTAKKKSAAGIPDRDRFEPFSEDLKGKNLRLIIQKHGAERAGLHYDIRIVDDQTGKAYSFTTRDLSLLSKPKSRGLVIEQPLHTAEYARWSGVLTHGYGKGKVEVIYNEPIEVIDANKDKITFIIPKSKVATEISLIRTDYKKGRGWVIVNHTTTTDTFPISYHKPPYKEQPFDAIDVKNDKYVVTAKIDGAHSVVILRPGKTPRFFSYRRSKLNRPLEYTWKMPPDLYLSRWPRDQKELWLRGEIYGIYKDTGEPIPENELGRILNSSVDKARKYMAERDIELRFAPFMVEQIGSKKVQLPYEKQLPILDAVARLLPKTELPARAIEQAEKEKLLKLIKERKFKQTQEGIVLWPLKDASPPIKAKLRPDFDVVVRDIFMEKGLPLPKNPNTKYLKRYRMSDGSIRYEYPKDKRPPMAGGFYYSRDEKGKTVGRVGTGFSIPLKIDMALHPEKYKGMVARVTAMHEFPSGSLRAPAFIGWHHEKSGPRASEVIQK